MVLTRFYILRQVSCVGVNGIERMRLGYADIVREEEVEKVKKRKYWIDELSPLFSKLRAD